MKQINLLIVGAGAAGMTAALYAKRKNLNSRIFEKKTVGGMTANAIWVENYLGVGRIKGRDLMEKFKEHLKLFNIEIEKKEVKDIKKTNSNFEISFGEEKLLAKAVILATGTRHKNLGVMGEKELFGKGVSYCSVCDAPFFKDKTVVVAGGGNSGTTAALYMEEICKKVYLVEFQEKLRCDEYYQQKIKKSKIKLFLGNEIKEILGEEKVSGVRVLDRKTKKEQEIAADGVFIYAGLLPQNELAKKLGAKINENGFVVTDENCKTSVSGFFAAGDVTGRLAQIIVAAGYGAVAALSAYAHIKEQEYHKNIY